MDFKAYAKNKRTGFRTRIEDMSWTRKGNQNRNLSERLKLPKGSTLSERIVEENLLSSTGR